MAIMQQLAFAPWEPDQPAMGGRTLTARNVIPAAGGFRPFPGLVQRSGLEPLPSACLGAFSARDSGRTTHTFAGTSGALYSLEATGWSARGTGLATAAEEGWDFTAYGDTVLATNSSDAPQACSIAGGGTGQFSQVQGAPKARRLGVIRDFVFLGALAGNARTVRWSALDNPLFWPEPGSQAAVDAQSDIQVFPVGGEVQAVVGGVGNADGIILLEEAVYRAMYVGPPYIFQFDPVDRRRGTVAPASAVNLGGGAVAYLAVDGWHLCDGVTARPIGIERVDDWFMRTADLARLREVRGAVDAQNRVAVWTFPTPAAPPGVHDMAMAYHYVLDRWSTAAFDSEMLLEHRSPGLSLEELGPYGSLDALPFSLDARALSGGSLGVAAFDPAHRLATMSGLPMEALLETMETGGERMLVQGVRPLVDGAAAEAGLRRRDSQAEAVVDEPFGAVSSLDGMAPFHVSCRYARALVRIPAGAAWRMAVGAEMACEPEGTA